VIRYLQCASHLHDKRITVCSVSKNNTVHSWTCVYAMYFLRQIANGSSHTGMLLKIEKWIWLRICKCQSTFAFTAHICTGSNGWVHFTSIYRYENPNPNPNPNLIGKDTDTDTCQSSHYFQNNPSIKHQQSNHDAHTLIR